MLMAISGVYDDSSDGSSISIGKPNVLRKKGYDFILLQILRIENGRPGKSVGYCIMRAFDVRYFHTEVGKLYAPSSMSVREVLGLFEELETDMIRIHVYLVGRGDKDVSPFSQGVHDAEHFSIMSRIFAFRG